MNLETEGFALKYVEDNELVSPDRLGNVSESKIKNNGFCGGAIEQLDDVLLAEVKRKAVEVTKSVNSPPLTSKSGGSINSTPVTMKGYGLKKWRRIRRDCNKDGSGETGTGKVLKRGLPGLMVNSTKAQNSLSVGTKQRSESSVSSANAKVKNLDIAIDGFSIHGPQLESRPAVGPSFAAGTDSENSEDRSSKSSTAASAPKLRYEIPLVLGYAQYNNGTRSLRGKSSGNQVQKVQQGKGQMETSKKPRGEQIKNEKENSHSSMESDSRSSNFVFMQGSISVTSNRRQSGRSTDYDWENGDEAQGGEQQLREEIQTGYGKENVQKFEFLSQDDPAACMFWRFKERRNYSHRSSTDQDPLALSIFTLQSAQEALEKEVQKFSGIGKEHILLSDYSTRNGNLHSEFAFVDPNICKSSSSDEVFSEDIGLASSESLENQVMKLKQKVNILQSKLEEARAILREKEAELTELEATVESKKSLLEETRSSIELQQKYFRELEGELEDLFKQKIEAEVEYLAMSSTAQLTFSEEQKLPDLQQAQMLNELEDAESNVAMLKKKTKLETNCGDKTETGEVSKPRHWLCKAALYFFVQLIALVLLLFVLQLSTHYAGVVPT